MEYQKIANLLGNVSIQQFKFRTRNWVEINDDTGGAYSSDKQIRFKTAIVQGLVYVTTVMHIYLLKEI